MIETEHRGFKLHMNEQTEEWRCNDLEIDAVIGLNAIKARIDRMLKDGRKLGDLKVLKLSGGAGRFRDKVEVVEATATLLCAPKQDWRTNQDVITQCWVTDRKGIKTAIVNLYPLSARAAIEAWRKLCDEANAATARADEAEEALPRFKSDADMMRAAREAAVRKAETEA